MRPHIQVVVLTLLGLTAVGASARVPQETHTIEASTDEVSMPATVDGILVFRSCHTCPALTLRSTARTQYRIDNQLVTLKAFTDFARLNRGGIGLSYKLSTSELVRVDMFSPPSSSTSAR